MLRSRRTCRPCPRAVHTRDQALGLQTLPPSATLACLAQELKSLSGDERDDAERRAKQRLLGNIRLIAELFNKGQVNDRIMLLILADLLGAPDNDPPEDSVEVGRGGGGRCARATAWEAVWPCRCRPTRVA
jgi:hypothetical protein